MSEAASFSALTLGFVICLHMQAQRANGRIIMTFNQIIMYIMAAGVLLGGADRIAGNRLGYGDKFEAGFKNLAPLAFGTVGIICIAPVLARWLAPVLGPVYQKMGADPAMFGSFFALDMGGYPLAEQLADDPALALFSGLIVASMLGVTITYTVPMGLAIIPKEDLQSFAKGLMLGIIPIPAGCLAGGLMMRLKLDCLFINLLPVCTVTILLIIGLVRAPQKLVRGFYILGTGVRIFTYAGLTLAAVEYLTGIIVIQGMTPILDAMVIPCKTSVILLGSLPVMEMISRTLRRPFERLGGLAGINAPAVAGILMTCATTIPVMQILHEMNPKGKVVVTAWMVSAIALFTAHLGFTIGVAPWMGAPVVFGKLVSGLLALAIACRIPADSRFMTEG